MKKYALLISLILGANHSYCQSMEDTSINESLYIKDPILRNAVDEKISGIKNYFEVQKKSKPPIKRLSKNLKRISEPFDFYKFSRYLLANQPQTRNEPNELIVARFIQGGASMIIRSPEYSYENPELFNLVEDLDPILRQYWALAANHR